MQILPVLDLKGGQVVRGVAGRRATYRPIESPLAADPTPLAVATGIAQHFGLRELYLADLDALEGAPPAWHVYRQLLAAGFELWVDAGLATLDRAAELAEFTSSNRRVTGVIAALESSTGPQQLGQLVELASPERLVFSLDLKGGQPLSRNKGWENRDAESIAQTALELGVRRMIVLDLASVGMNSGLSTLDLCRALRKREPQIELTTGGGVRDAKDLEAIREAGCAYALVASALHDGRIGPTRPPPS